MTSYLEKYVIKQIEHYIPEGIDPLLHINCRAFMYDVIETLVEEQKNSAKVSGY